MIPDRYPHYDDHLRIIERIYRVFNLIIPPSMLGGGSFIELSFLEGNIERGNVSNFSQLYINEFVFFPFCDYEREKT